MVFGICKDHEQQHQNDANDDHKPFVGHLSLRIQWSEKTRIFQWGFELKIKRWDLSLTLSLRWTCIDKIGQRRGQVRAAAR